MGGRGGKSAGGGASGSNKREDKKTRPGGGGVTPESIVDAGTGVRLPYQRTDGAGANVYSLSEVKLTARGEINTQYHMMDNAIRRDAIDAISKQEGKRISPANIDISHSDSSGKIVATIRTEGGGKRSYDISILANVSVSVSPDGKKRRFVSYRDVVVERTGNKT